MFDGSILKIKFYKIYYEKSGKLKYLDKLKISLFAFHSGLT